MADILQELLKRRSCRKYKSSLIKDEELEKIITAGEYAASGKNLQSAIIIAVTNKAVRDKISAMNAAVLGQGPEVDPFYGAPEILIVLADKNVPTHIYDGALVMGNMMAEASSLGIGSCWIHRAREEFQTEEGKAMLKAWGISGDYEGIGHLAIGYPVVTVQKALPKPPPRKKNYVYFIK
ncbi:MAG TPA: diguanylate cyclase [Treponema sp.]|nr:diguanylate cyclase [Treponema sp.]